MREGRAFFVALQHLVSRAVRLVRRAVEPVAVRRVAHVAQCVQTARRERHAREKRPVHHRDAEALQDRRHFHQGHLREFVLEWNQGKPRSRGKGIRLRIRAAHDRAHGHFARGRLYANRTTRLRPNSLDARIQSHFHTGSPHPFQHDATQLGRIEGVLANAKDIFDQSPIEEPLHVLRSGFDRSTDSLHAPRELLGRHLRTLPRDGVDLLEIRADGGAKLGDESREVHPTSQRGEYAARVVVAVVNAGLVRIRRSFHQARAALAQQNAAELRSQHLGQIEAVKPAANDQCIPTFHVTRPPRGSRTRSSRVRRCRVSNFG